MNRYCLCLFLLSALSVFAKDEVRVYNPAKDRPTTPEEIQIRKEWIARRRYEHFGGDVQRPGTQKGVINVVNCQSLADDKLVSEAVDYLKQETKFNIVVIPGSFSFPNVQVKGNMSLFVINDDKLPGLLLAPEDKWAYVNVARLKEGRGNRQQFFTARVKKEFSRAFAGLCGALSSNYPGSLTTGIYNLDQLDKQEDNRLSVDVISRFAPSVEAAGITPAIVTTYLAACKQGWAEDPTNDVQKAIWDDVHKLPSNPIVIKPETKPVKD